MKRIPERDPIVNTPNDIKFAFFDIALYDCQMPETIESFSRYLPTDQQARKWGWRLIDAGRQSAKPDTPYPSEAHPISYLFDNDGRRTLDEFQMVYIATGSGTFESKSQVKMNISAGTALLLFPNEWHRYAPAPESGWTEYWLGFGGREAARIMDSFFSPDAAVLNVSQTDALLQHLHQILFWLNQPVAAKEQILASHIPLTLALLNSSKTPNEATHNSDGQLVMLAKAEMLQHISDRTDLEGLATTLGVSYSRFRFAFKNQTGYSPREYENMIKLNRARDLLLRERCTVSEVALQLGYSSVYYFSRAFKKQFKQSPQQWLKGQRSQASR
jgi:AraC-like DNA-binding protein